MPHSAKTIALPFATWLFVAAFLLSCVPLFAHASDVVQHPNPAPGTNVVQHPNPDKTTLQNPLKNVDSLETLLKAILKAVVQLGSMVLVIALVWVGAQFVFARGNPEQISSARSALMWTVIGGLVLLGAQAISMVIQTTAGALQ